VKFSLLYFWDPAQAGPAEGEFSDWLALDAEIKESGAPHVWGRFPSGEHRSDGEREGGAGERGGRSYMMAQVTSRPAAATTSCARSRRRWCARSQPPDRARVHPSRWTSWRSPVVRTCRPGTSAASSASPTASRRRPLR
jgi:hypothetical protein